MTTAAYNPKTSNSITERMVDFLSQLASRRASRRERVQARRSALAMSEEARIQAQAEHRAVRSRQYAG